MAAIQSMNSGCDVRFPYSGLGSSSRRQLLRFAQRGVDPRLPAFTLGFLGSSDIGIEPLRRLVVAAIMHPSPPYKPVLLGIRESCLLCQEKMLKSRRPEKWRLEW
ncbi:MAG: hypothetical protein R3E51_14210 [Rhizobiaceae bacterium]